MTGPRPSRRGLLAAAGAGTAALAGCSAFSTTPDPFYVTTLAASNRDDEPHELSVRIAEDEAVVLEETVSLAPDTDGSEADGACLPPVTEPGRYSFELTVDGEASSRFAPAEGESVADCYGVEFRVSPDGEPVVLHTNNCRTADWTCGTGARPPTTTE